ncbi:hypothetical protein MJO29_000764 [Puccinia striiformis f. sp. tritici]|nr:hypothetical protein MJO29_000764 [Puccinia striiformis f. sp. tritici]
MDESISSLHTQTTQLQVVFLPPKAHIQIDQSYSSWAHAVVASLQFERSLSTNYNQIRHYISKRPEESLRMISSQSA